MTDPASPTLRASREGAVISLVLSRPQVHDAFDEAMIAELTQALRDAARDDDARVVVLRSTGRSFCAGADLNWMRRIADNTREENLADAGRLDDMFQAMVDCPKPIVARVQGAALGGGCGLVAAADVAVASVEARLGFPEVRHGILPAVIAPYVLRKVSPGRAQGIFLTGETFSADIALELGLVSRVVSASELDAAVDAVVASLLHGSASAQAGVKRLLRQLSGLDAEAARVLTTDAIATARASEDGREGIAAFLGKRRSRWAPPSP